MVSSWDKLDPGLQQKLTEIGITPPPPSPELDLKDVLRDNLAQRCCQQVEAAGVHPSGLFPQEAEPSKQDRCHQEGLQELLDEMKLIQTKLEQEQTELNSTSSLTLCSFRRTLT